MSLIEIGPLLQFLLLTDPIHRLSLIVLFSFYIAHFEPSINTTISDLQEALVLVKSQLNEGQSRGPADHLPSSPGVYIQPPHQESRNSPFSHLDLNQ